MMLKIWYVLSHIALKIAQVTQGTTYFSLWWLPINVKKHQKYNKQIFFKNILWFCGLGIWAEQYFCPTWHELLGIQLGTNLIWEALFTCLICDGMVGGQCHPDHYPAPRICRVSLARELNFLHGDAVG